MPGEWTNCILYAVRTKSQVLTVCTGCGDLLFLSAPTHYYLYPGVHAWCCVCSRPLAGPTSTTHLAWGFDTVFVAVAGASRIVLQPATRLWGAERGFDSKQGPCTSRLRRTSDAPPASFWAFAKRWTGGQDLMLAHRIECPLAIAVPARLEFLEGRRTNSSDEIP